MVLARRLCRRVMHYDDAPARACRTARLVPERQGAVPPFFATVYASRLHLVESTQTFRFLLQVHHFAFLSNRKKYTTVGIRQ